MFWWCWSRGCLLATTELDKFSRGLISFPQFSEWIPSFRAVATEAVRAWPLGTESALSRWADERAWSFYGLPTCPWLGSFSWGGTLGGVLYASELLSGLGNCRLLSLPIWLPLLLYHFLLKGSLFSVKHCQWNSGLQTCLCLWNTCCLGTWPKLTNQSGLSFWPNDWSEVGNVWKPGQSESFIWAWCGAGRVFPFLWFQRARTT